MDFASIPNKDLRKFARKKGKEGWTVEKSSGSHLKWTHETGATIFSSSTPTCPYVEHKIERDMRKALKG